jgi:hypothetical protein
MHLPSIESNMDLKKPTHSRADAFVNGTKFVLNQQGKLTEGLNTSINVLLDETHKLIEQQSVELPHYSRIVNRLIENLATMSKLTEKDIALGEAYWAWQVYERPTRESEIKMTGQNAEVSLHIAESAIKPHLTDLQKGVLIQIHNSPIPDWVMTLRNWEKKYLKTIIPKDITGDWSGYEKVLPATLRRIPGLSNATQRLFVFTDSDGREIKKRGYRQGVPTAYAMPSSHYQTSAEENIRQMLEAIKSNVKQDFQAYWGLPEGSRLQSPVLLLGLLTHKEHGNTLQTLIDTEILYSGVTLSGEENNTQRTQDKSTAIRSLQADYPDITLLDLNIGVNIGRGWVLGVPVDNFINKVEEILAAIRTEKKPLSQLLQTRATEADAAISALKIHNGIPLRRDRNKDLFSAALCHYVTEKLGGSVITNCKSAKDRTGLEIIMADAIDIYVRIYGEFPKYDENNLAKREQFINIFKAIFDSQHHQLIANDNSPGSQGIKDEGMLDEDIIESLGQTYTLGKKIADLNKPKSFFQKNSKIIFRSLLFLGTIASIGLIASGVFAPLGLILGIVLSIALPYAVSFGVYGGYAAYDARQAAVAVKKYDAESQDDYRKPRLLRSNEEESLEDKLSEKSLKRRDAGIFARDVGEDSWSKQGSKFSALSETEDVMLVDSVVPSEPQRTINEVEIDMSEVAAQLNKAAEVKYESKYNESDRTVQILEKTKKNVVVMAASTDRVAMYKPLLQAEIALQDKAILFLKALGIPPTDGKEKIKIRGGHHDLRQAIRDQFQEYLAKPQSSNQKRL